MPFRSPTWTLNPDFSPGFPMMACPRWFWVRSFTLAIARGYVRRSRNAPRATWGVSAPKERDAKHTVKQSISLSLFEFNAFVSVRSSHCTGMCRCREAQGKDCSRQSFCISSIPGGQIVRERPGEKSGLNGVRWVHGSGERLTLQRSTRSAPARSSVRASSTVVAPVVTTSSTIATWRRSPIRLVFMVNAPRRL